MTERKGNPTLQERERKEKGGGAVRPEALNIPVRESFSQEKREIQGKWVSSSLSEEASPHQGKANVSPLRP